jgi:hypothetical protein
MRYSDAFVIIQHVTVFISTRLILGNFSNKLAYVIHI